MEDKVRTDESIFWDQYSEVHHDVTSQLDKMLKRLAWVCDQADSFKRMRGSSKREEAINTTRDELSDICNRDYRDALDAIAKLTAMVGMEIESYKMVQRMEEDNG